MPSTIENAVAGNVVSVTDYVAKIDPDAEDDPPILIDLRIALDHCPLHFGRAAHRVNDAGEFRQQPIAGCFDNSAVMLVDLGIDEVAPMSI